MEKIGMKPKDVLEMAYKDTIFNMSTSIHSFYDSVISRDFSLGKKDEGILYKEFALCGGGPNIWALSFGEQIGRRRMGQFPIYDISAIPVPPEKVGITELNVATYVAKTLSSVFPFLYSLIWSDECGMFHFSPFAENRFSIPMSENIPALEKFILQRDESFPNIVSLRTRHLAVMNQAKWDEEIIPHIAVAIGEALGLGQ